MKLFSMLLLCAIGSQAQNLTLDSTWRAYNWDAKTFYGVSTLPGGGIAVDIPTQKNKFLDYVYGAYYGCPLSLSGAVTITFQVGTTGAPAFYFDSEKTNTGTFPAHMRAYIESATIQPNGLNRWWANPISYQLDTLLPGVLVMAIPLTPDQWTSTYGQRGSDDAQTFLSFQQSMASAVVIGISLGGGDFFGHGVRVAGGTAQVQLLGVSIQ